MRTARRRAAGEPAAAAPAAAAPVEPLLPLVLLVPVEPLVLLVEPLVLLVLLVPPAVQAAVSRQAECPQARPLAVLDFRLSSRTSVD